MTRSTQIDETLERGYNVRAARSDYDDIIKDWMARSEAVRSAADAELDVAYGAAERQKLDIFRAPAGGPTLVYLHGGYWQRGDKSAYSFLADAFVRRGVNLVVMGYTLCPDTTVPGIVDEIRSGVAWLYRQGKQYGLAPERLNVAGHSAGGYLTAMVLATDWAEHGGDLPGDVVKAGIPISGLYDLEPLRRTSINEMAGIDEDAARACSPMLMRPPAEAPVLAVVGGGETGAFHWQTEEFVKRWSEAGARMERHVEPDVDHFDVVERLGDGESGLFGKVLEVLV